MPKNSSYRKLRGSAFFSSNKLFTGSDHLLSSNSNFFSEEYLRFYYRDIQALITRKTITGKVLSICYLAIVVLSLIPVFLLSGGWAVFFSIVAAIFFILLMVNLVKGPTSICHIQTPVQTVRLLALKRIKSTEKAVSQLKTLIEGSQGLLDRERIENVKAVEFSGASLNKNDISPIRIDGRYHLALFSILTVSTAFILLEIFFSNIFVSILSGIVNLGIAVVLVICLRKQTRSNIYKSIKVLAWSIPGYLGLKYFLGYILMVSVTVKNPGVAYVEWDLVKEVATISPLEHTWIMPFYILYLFFTVVIGLAGVILTVMFRKEHISSGANLSNKEFTALDLEHE